MQHRLLDRRQGSLEDIDARGEGKASITRDGLTVNQRSQLILNGQIW